MGKRHPNYRLVKIHRSYTVEEISKLFGNHKNTVRRWVKEGLATNDDKRPMLILGHVLVTFLRERRARNKRSCRPGELYCVCCRASKPPAGDMAEFSPINEKFGNLIAICPDCDSIMNQRVSLSRIGEFYGKVDISFPEALPQLIERAKPTVNSDKRGGESDYGKAQSSE
jgi:hypothetical protein